jgi:2-dehydro-3-deoxygluconokinase
MSHVIWRDFDGLGRNTRVGLNFTEKGFGIRAALGCSDRGHSAASQIKPGEFNWEKLFGEEGVRRFHNGGIFAALDAGTSEAVATASPPGSPTAFSRARDRRRRWSTAPRTGRWR